MSSHNKKILVIVVLAVLIITAIVLYFVKSSKTTKVEANYQQISKQSLLFPTLSTDGARLIYFNNQQEPGFYSMKVDGTDVKKTLALDTPDEVFYSPDKSQAILQVVYDKYVFEKYGSKFASPGTPDQALTTWSLDLMTGSLKKLDNRITSVCWLSDSSFIYEILDQDNGVNDIYSAKANGAGAVKVVSLPSLNSYGMSVEPNGQDLIVYTIPTDVSPTTLYKLNLPTKTFSKITELADPVKIIALAGDRALATLKPASATPKLVIVSQTGQKDLKVEATTNNIVLTAENEIFVAAKDSKKQSSLFYKINLDSADKTVISLKPPISLNINYLSISPDRKTIYFFESQGAYKLAL